MYSIVFSRTSYNFVLSMHADTTEKYEWIDSNYYDHDTFGDKTYQFHPPRHPTPESLPSLTTMVDCDSKVNTRAQGVFTAIVHHHTHHTHLLTHRPDTRYSTVFVCASQPHAGDFLHAVPSHLDTTLSSNLMSTAIQRRLGLPIFPPPTAPHDPFGDSLQNDGSHSVRHDKPKLAFFCMLESTYGRALSICDPSDGSHMDYSPTHIPDVGVLFGSASGKHTLGDVKVVSPFTTSLSKQDTPRGAAIAFAHTEEPMKEKILGRPAFARPANSTGRFNRYLNTGSRVAKPADYSGAIARGHEVLPIIFEVFGGWAPGAVKFFRRVARAHRNRLAEPLTSWAARTFTSYHAQRVSVAIQSTACQEILTGIQYAISETSRARRTNNRARLLPPGARGTAQHA